MNQTYIQHADIKNFAGKKVNLPSEHVKKYRDRIKKLHDDLARYINDNPDYDLVKMFHSGSLAKGTALRTINDLDVAIYIKKSDSLAEGTKLLEWLKERLHEVYPKLKDDQIKIPAGAHCVTIEFKSESMPNVDVVPVIYEGDENDMGYLTTKSTGEKVLTSIPMHLKFINKRKSAQPTDYAQVARLLKWWIKIKKEDDDSFKFKSFMAELICAHLADNGLDMSNYIHALEQIFKYIIVSNLDKRIYFTDFYAVDKLPEQTDAIIEIFDPVNPDNIITDKYAISHRDKIVNAAMDALDAITEAHYATEQERAIDLWKSLFGPTFNINL
ncbi:nucleotidyltransferase [Candidatus Parcubacteria bacterium]|nr:nucleotidyltransferase [Candidatus Parcubacteria bacterium]